MKGIKMSNALRSQKSTIAWGGAAPAGAATKAAIIAAASAATFNFIDEATEIKPSNQKVTEIDVSSLDSDAKEFVLGLEDSGQVDVTANFTGSEEQQQLFTEKANKSLSLYQITIGQQLSTPIKFSFYGYVVKAELPDAKIDGKIELQATIRISGPVAINWGSLAVTP